MADKKASKKKNIIVGICSALIVIIIIIIIAVVINANKKIDDSYFVSDGNKYVLSIDYSTIASDIETNEQETPYLPNRVHQVYMYSGDKITGLKYYYEYNDASAAKAALEYIKAEDSEVNITTEGKYVIITADESDYSDYSASEIKETIDFYQNSINNQEVKDMEGIEE